MTTLPIVAQGRELGGYELLYALKSGGMGDVLLARKVGAGGFEKLVAIKTVKTEFREHEEVRKMFFDEAKLVARLQHPAIAQVHDFGDDRGELFIVMEYVQGVRFRALGDRRPPPAIAARAVAEALRGLHAAHEQTDLAGDPLEVVHRDITPENLMLSFDGQVKVLDFGIALARGRQAPVTEFGTIKGKPPYLSPEQIKCEPLDRRTDIFSMAIVLHELLTGEPLFVGESVYATARKIEHMDVPLPSATAGPLPPGLDEAVMQGLQRNRDERFQTAEAFARALEAVADGASDETLAEYARRELAREHEEHRKWLRGVLTSVQSELAKLGPRGRASGVMTVPAEADAPPAKPATGNVVFTPASIPSFGARKNRSFAVVLAILLLAAGAVVAYLALRDRGGEATGELAVVEVPDAAPAIAIATPDAAPVIPVATPDATPTPEPKPKPRAKPRPKPKPDPAPDPVPPPPDPTPKPTEFGYLTVAADPFANVRIDGVEIGTTPMFRRKVAAGPHEVVLVSPDTGAIRLRKRIDLAPNEHERVVAK